MQNDKVSLILAGICAGAVTGFFGAGGGMILVPMLVLFTTLDPATIFPTSLSIILPVCLVALAVTAFPGNLPLAASLPYLAGSAIGGIAAGFLGPRIPVKWLHKLLGIFILWGGIRYLCQS